MSLIFSHDPRSKREKQEIFKKSLDDQRRTEQEATHASSGQQYQRDPYYRCVPGLEGDVPGGNRIPGLGNHEQVTAYAPRFESTPTQEKQPYMSALSEMNGRPLHVRQQQFEKESRYRNMLRDQIEENRKRKETEKAKLDEEKRRELEELQRLQGKPAPRRQQLAQFQESPDHPLPSPGRLPPAPHPGSHASQGGDRGVPAPAYGGLPEYGSRSPGGGRGLDAGGGWQPRDGGPDDRHGRDRPSRDHDALSPMGPVTGYDRAGGRHTGAHPQDAAPNGCQAHRQGGIVPQASEEDADRTWPPQREREERGSERKNDVVPRADFDELSDLCRDLLLEQKELRRKLEEREEREMLAEQARRNEHPHGEPRRGGVGPNARGAVPANGNGRRSSRQVTGSIRRAQCDRAREIGVRRDKTKQGVAFGSTLPRMEQTHVGDRPRATAGSKQVSRGVRDPRVSKSEPVPRSEGRDLWHRRSAASTHGAGRGKHLANHESPDVERASGVRNAGQDRASAGWAPRQGVRGNGSSRRSDMENGGTTIHSLLGRGINPRGPSGEGGPVQADARSEFGELGGESTFLAANDSGIPDVLQRRAGPFAPGAAADAWSARR